MTDEQILAQLTAAQTLGLTVYGESRGEAVEGRIAVAAVIRNRLGRYGADYKGVCLKPKQFSCWNLGDPNRDQLLSAGRMLIRHDEVGPDLRECLWIAEGIIGEVVRSNVGKATHYMTRALWQTAPPTWAIGHLPSHSIGRHVFFTGIA
jgi:N-acetylmuramoyl-L-alanine amidase